MFREKADERAYFQLPLTRQARLLDRDACDFSKAEFENGSGTVHVEGGLTLDYVKVRCIADIDLRTLEEKGRLEKVELTVEADVA